MIELYIYIVGVLFFMNLLRGKVETWKFWVFSIAWPGTVIMILISLLDE